MPLKVLALNCSLKRTGESSSTDRLLKEVLDALGQHDAEGESSASRRWISSPA